MTTKEETKAVVQWKGEAIAITFSDVKKLICPDATDQEVGIFLKVCQSLNLNPWANEIYLIKYGKADKAAIVITIDAYLKAAEFDPNFDGYEAGIVLKDPRGGLEFREGAFLLEEERAGLVGGWARIYRKDRSRPFYVAVNKKECIRLTREGRLTEFWAEEKQPWMLRKVALKRALLEAFTSLFSGLASELDYEATPTEVLEALPKPKGETAEGQLPPAYQKNGEPDWAKFWARQKEKGLDSDRAHSILGIASLKTDWIEKGRTLEEADEVISAYLAFLTKHAAKTKPAFSPGQTPGQPAPQPRAAPASPGEDTMPDITHVTPGPTPPPRRPRDMATILTVGDALTFIREDFRLDRHEVARRCGLKDPDDLAKMSPAAIYLQVAGMEG